MSDSKRIKLTTSKTLESKEKIKKEDVKCVKKEEKTSSSEQSSASLQEITRKLPDLTIKKSSIKKEGSTQTSSKSTINEKPVITIFKTGKNIKKETTEDVKIKIEPEQTPSNKVVSTVSKMPKQTKKELDKKKLSDQISDKGTRSKQHEIITCNKTQSNYRTRRVSEFASLNDKKNEKEQKTEKNKKELITVTKSKSTEKGNKLIKIPDSDSKLNISLKPKGHQQEPKSYPKTVRLNLELPVLQDEDQYPEFNYNQLIKDAEKKESESEEDENIAKRYEQKYAPNEKKKGKKIIDTQEIWEGYDETDPFIDNSTPHDEVVPDDVTTELGGFYVNTGILKFRKIEPIDSESSTETNDTDIIQKLPKLRQIGKKTLKVPAKKIQRRQLAKKNIHLKREKNIDLKKRTLKKRVYKKAIAIKKLREKMNTTL